MTGSTSTRSLEVGLRLTGAATWVVLLGARLMREDRSLWLARDDGVITLSHARNLVEFGTIGVSPVGDRVEGYSSPLHLGIAAGFNLVRTWDAATLTVVIMVTSVAVSGWCVADLLAARRSSQRWSAAGVLGGTAAAGLIVAASWSATGWIGSGMENPVVVATGLAIAAIAARSGSGWSPLIGALALVAFAVSRVELAALAIPVGMAGRCGSGRRRTARQLHLPLRGLGGVRLVRAVRCIAGRRDGELRRGWCCHDLVSRGWRARVRVGQRLGPGRRSGRRRGG